MSKKPASPRLPLIFIIMFIISISIAELFSSQFAQVQVMLTLPLSPTGTSSRQSTALTPTSAATTIPSPIPEPISTRPVAPALAGLTIVGLMRDTFQRNNQTFWGNSSGGLPWEGDAASNNAFFIKNNHGIIAGQGSYYSTIQPATANMQVLVTGSTSSFQHAALGVLLFCATDHSSWYRASIDGGHFSLQKRTHGSTTTIQVVAFSAGANTTYTLRFLVLDMQLFAKVWATDSPEPENWQITSTDASARNGFAGIYANIKQGETITIDEFRTDAFEQ